jgi:hypothetical protein
MHGNARKKNAPPHLRQPGNPFTSQEQDRFSL